MHNIYEVIMYIMYNEKLLNMFPAIRNPCDGFARNTTPSLAIGGESISTDIIRSHPYNTS